MKIQDFEILSPVGSYPALMAAIEAGADSVYFGVGKLNMRSNNSANFDYEDLKQISDICKQNNINSYLTVNTVVYDQEIEDMRSLLNRAKECGVNSIIASDMSVISYANSIDMPIHLSTQCNITNIEAVKWYSQFAEVIVLAREVSLDKVKIITKAIKDQDIRGKSGKPLLIECFVHGALCMAVSGKCYISLDNANRSANRGECMQFCRRPYLVTDMDGGVQLSIDNQYILSPKDLKTIDFFDKIIDAGVKVFKIEGRGRSPEYVKTVTRCYKQALQSCIDNDFTQQKIDSWNIELCKVYNRGFWDGYYLGRKVGQWSKKYGSSATTTKIFIGTITNFFKNISVAELTIETGEIHLGDNIYIIGPTTGVYEDKITQMRLEDKQIDMAKKGDIISIPTKNVVRRNDKLYLIVYKEDV